MFNLRQLIKRRSALASRPAINRYSPEGVRSNDYRVDKSTIRRLKAGWQEHMNNIPAYPDIYEGRGIVICAGGIKYFTCAWVNIHLLREQGCTLPVEMWYTGQELTEEVIAVMRPLGVTCRNALEYAGAGFTQVALKPFAILNSSFKEVLFLDADNNSVADPGYLFEEPCYRSTGTIFWPDYWTTHRDNPIWKITGSDAYDSVEQESGQLLVNKERCWKELQLCLYFNQQKECYYQMLLGDKDTFRFAWLALASPYFMVPAPVGVCGYMNPETKTFFGMTMVQHDPAGRILFMHRNLLKWDVTSSNEQIWEEVRRFRHDAVNKTIRISFVRHQHSPGGFCVNDLEGDVEVLLFQQLFGDLESHCLDLLETLRSAPFYHRFLQQVYFNFFKADYIHNVTPAVLNA